MLDATPAFLEQTHGTRRLVKLFVQLGICTWDYCGAVWLLVTRLIFKFVEVCRALKGSFYFLSRGGVQGRCRLLLSELGFSLLLDALTGPVIVLSPGKLTCAKGAALVFTFWYTL